MSVLIKDMELPKDCRECKMLTYYSTSGCSMCDITGNALARNFKPIPFDGIPDWCPLVEVHEPHGRLVDADEPDNVLANGIIEAADAYVEHEKEQLSCEGTTSDMISRQAALEAINSWRGRFSEEYNEAIDDCENSIKELPTIQPERKKGEWIEISSMNHTYKCSECGRLLVNVADGRNNVSKHYPYCHCGADMRGEKDARTD